MLTSVPTLKMRPRNSPGVRELIRQVKIIDAEVGRPIPVVSDEGFEERPGLAGLVQHDGGGDLDMVDGQLPPVASPLLSRAKGLRGRC